MQEIIFKDFLSKKINKIDIVVNSFHTYFDLLCEANKTVNLISRKTPVQDYWTVHFLDSILPIGLFDFAGKKILDFGTGGGLPGIPLKLLYPTSDMYLLDSTRKKILAVKNIVKKLDLKECFTIVSRLEDLDEKWENYFDFIVCRSVKILPKYKTSMFKLLRNNGRIILYKSRKLDDVQQFKNFKIHDVSLPVLGERKIIEIKKEKKQQAR
jgi:16S rRNA (guanine527-N7)-methyltransferase